MKKLFVLLGVFCALCFVACSNFQLAGGDMGVVSLSIGDNLAREIRSAASLRSATGGSYTLTASIRGEYSDSQTVAVANGNYSGVTFTFEGVPVGKDIILDLTAKAGSNYIWYGNSGKHTVEQGENLLTIALGRVSGVLMWDNSSVKIAPYGNYDFDNATGTGVPKVSPVWCVDKYGNVYVAQDTDVGTGGVRQNVIKADGSYSSLDYYNHAGKNFTGLTYDNTTRILYGIENGDDGVKLRYAPAQGQDFKNVTKGVDAIVFSGDELGIAVSTDSSANAVSFMYTASIIGENDAGIPIIRIDRYSLSVNKQGDSILSVENTDVKEGDGIQLRDNFGTAPTGQMIYHEGALYLLLRRVEINDASNASEDFPAEHFSIGALVKINPTTLSLDTSFGNGGYLGLSSMKKNFTDLSALDGTSVAAVDFYGSGNDTSTFYGPVGFVAIMPKKLVIADAGFSMEQEGIKVNLTKKTRVITVDLETLAFETERVEDSYYQSEYPSSSTAGYSYIVITN